MAISSLREDGPGFSLATVSGAAILWGAGICYVVYRWMLYPQFASKEKGDMKKTNYGFKSHAFRFQRYALNPAIQVEQFGCSDKISTS